MSQPIATSRAARGSAAGGGSTQRLDRLARIEAELEHIARLAPPPA